MDKANKMLMLASRFLLLIIFGSESGCLGLKNQAFGIGSIPKINFRRSWISHDSRVYFSGSGLKARGSRLLAHGQEKMGARAQAWRTQRQVFLGYEPWAMSLEAWAMNHYYESSNLKPEGARTMYFTPPCSKLFTKIASLWDSNICSMVLPECCLHVWAVIFDLDWWLA